MRKASNRAFSELLLHLYQCVQQPVEWQPLLRNIATVMGTDSASLRWVENNDLTLKRSYSYGLHQEYCTDVVRIDPFLSPLISHCQGRALRSQQLFSDEEYEQTEHYEAYFQPQDRFYAMGTVLSSGPEYNNYIGLHRSRRNGHFTRAEAEFMNAFTPHMQQALALQNRMSQVQQTIQYLERALGSLTTGVWLLNESLGVEWMNGVGYDVLHRNHQGFGQTLGRTFYVGSPTGPVTRALQQFLTGETERSSVWLTLPESDAALLVFAPDQADLNQINCESDSGQRQAVAVLLDTQRPTIADHQTLALQYRLSVAESKLAQMLLLGCDLSESADKLCISPHTARTHLKSIFEKTGSHRQAELIKKLMVFSAFNPEG